MTVLPLLSQCCCGLTNVFGRGHLGSLCSVGKGAENLATPGLPSHQPLTLNLICTTLSQVWDQTESWNGMDLGTIGAVNEHWLIICHIGGDRWKHVSSLCMGDPDILSNYVELIVHDFHQLWWVSEEVWQRGRLPVSSTALFPAHLLAALHLLLKTMMACTCNPSTQGPEIAGGQAWATKTLSQEEDKKKKKNRIL